MNKSVLVCDDDEGIIDVTTIILEDKGYKVIPINNCQEIFAKIEKSKPDVILLDLWMPNLTGEEITKELKKNKKLKNIPVIIVSASKDTEKVAKAAGADDFICKPFDIVELENMVEKHTT